MKSPRIANSIAPWIALGLILVLARDGRAESPALSGEDAPRFVAPRANSTSAYLDESARRSKLSEAPPAPTAFRTPASQASASARWGIDGDYVTPTATASEPGAGPAGPRVAQGPAPSVDTVVEPEFPLGPEGYLRGRPVGTYVDLDVQAADRPTYVRNDDDIWFASDDWDWQVLPTSLLYKSYLAGVKESRFATLHMYNKHDGWLWEPVLGARVGILRYGTHDVIHPQGWQLDIEGSAQARLYVPSNVDVRSVDFRGGMLLTNAYGPWRTKFGYYHLSSHLGDEFLLAHPGYPRLNYVRDALVFGEAFYLTDDIRIYFDVAWAFNCEYAKPWEFQFGIDFAPALPTGIRGAPFFAVNGYLRQELNYGGNFVVQAGWAWRGDEAGRLLRFGMQYINGKSHQFSFYNESDQELGLGLWYDF